MHIARVSLHKIVETALFRNIGIVRGLTTHFRELEVILLKFSTPMQLILVNTTESCDGGDACTAKFRREFSWACRTGCSPRLDAQLNMSMPARTCQWRTRDKMTHTVATNAEGTLRRHRRRHPIFLFSDVVRGENASAAAAPAEAEAADDGKDSPADVIVT